MDEKPPSLDPERVKSVVAVAHGDLAEVERLLAGEPALVNAAWDWGGGDWETGLGAASHMGRRDIAEFLIDLGARIDIFAAAMLGHVDVVRSLLDAYPHLVNAKGPHGIPLSAHAAVGGPEAEEVVALLDRRAAASAVS